MAQYTKHNSNYIRTVKHQNLKDGSSIFERDWVTIGSQLNFGPGKIPYYNDGNFIFTSNPTPFYQKRYKNGVTVATWTYDDVKEATATVNQIEFDEYTEDIRSFVYYGSCVELLRATIEKIIFEFPGNITLSEDRLEIPPTTEEGDYTYINGYIVNNPFQIDLHTKDVHLQQYDNELHFLSYSWQKYEVNGQPITSYVISDWMGDLDCPQNDQYYIKKAPVVTVTINGNIVLKGYKSDRDIIFCYEGQDLVIQPKEEVIEEYFKSLKGFEKQLLTRKTKPLYSNSFITPIEYDLDFLYYKRTYTWPSNGYCIDITSPLYTDFVNKMSNMAELYDELWTDNLWRRMTHEAIKNYDWTYTREFIEGDEQDNVDGGERMHKVLNVIGRVFDDIKLSIDTIKRQNKTTYSGDRNIPNALLSDKLELFGWDIYSTIPSYEENEQSGEETIVKTVSASEDVITDELLDTLTNDTYDYPWYPTVDPNKITFADVDVEFMRRLLLSTKRIFQTKGTKQSIDMVMGMFGYGNIDEENPNYIITERYMTVTPRRYDEVVDNESGETFGDRIVRLNNKEKEMRLLYEDDASGIPVASYIGGYDEEDNPISYLIPFYDQNKMYDGNMYFQTKGGWLYKSEEINDYSTEIVPVFSKWTETLSYLHVVSQVKDLLNSNPYELKNGDIYYVVNINDYIDFSESTDISLYSHFFVVKNNFMPEEISSWANLDLSKDCYNDGSYTEDEAQEYSNYVDKALYLESIIPYNIGNNPHVGYGEYDMGKEYIEYMSKPFKYAIDEHRFNAPYDEEAETIEFSIDNTHYTDTNDKIQILCNTSSVNDNGDIVIEKLDSNDNYFLNNKVIYLKNKIENDEYKKYFRTVIINYLMQVIPSTAIFVLENFILDSEKDDDSNKFTVTFIFANGTSRVYKKRDGEKVRCPSAGTKWRVQGGGDRIYDCANPNDFPYTVHQDTTFNEYVVIYYTVRFYETEGGQPTRTETIESGHTVNASGQWYRLGDANKTQVTFPYTVNNNVDFVRLVKYTVKWYNNADDTNPTTQQVTRGDNITALESEQRYYRKNDSTYTIVSFPIIAQQNEEFVKVTTYRVRWYQSEDDNNPEVQNNVIYGQNVTKSGQWCLMSSPQTIVSLPYRITQNTDFVKYIEPIVYYTVRFLDTNGTTVLGTQEIEEGQTVSPTSDLAQHAWYLSTDSTKTQVTFPYGPVNSSIDFIKVIEYEINWYDTDDTLEPPKFTVQFRLTETAQPIDTQEITAGENVSLRGECINYRWYLLGDSTKTQVTFPYRVNNDITFVRLNSRTVQWVDNGEQIPPVDPGDDPQEDVYVFQSVSPSQTTIAYNVSHTDFVIRTTLNGQLHNFSATVTQGQDWLSVDSIGSADAQNGTLTLKTTSYVNTGSQRTGSLRLVQNDSNKTITLQIMQEAVPQTDGEITLRVKNSRTTGVPIESAQITFNINGVDKVVGVGGGIPINGGERTTTFTINDSQKSQDIIADTVYIQPQMINANFTQSPNPYVYSRVGQDGAVELFIEILDEPEPITPYFELYPEFVPTNNNNLYPKVTGNTYSLPSSFYLMGNSNFFIRTKEVNTGEITITRSYKSIDYPYRIDDYGYGFMRAIFYDRWPGGQTTSYDSTVTFTPENDPTQAKTFKFLSQVDENNTEFQKGLLLSRLLRIPSSGLTGDIKMYFFPYSFNSSLFYDDIKCVVIDCSQVGEFDSNDNIIKYPTVTGVETANLVNNVFLEELLPTRVGATELNLHYKAGANNSADYKYAFVAIEISDTYSSYNNMSASRVHFIQEPYSANRVYYGDVPKDAKWWEAYVDSSDRSQRYHYMFQFTNSEILTGSREVTCAALRQDVPIQTVILVPTALPHTITSETGSYTELTSSEHYYWGNQEYTIYNLTTSNAVYTIQIL